MIVVVCGSREYSDRKRLKTVLDGVHAKRPITTLIECGNVGADRLAWYWAKSVGDIETKRIHINPRGIGEREAERRANAEALSNGVEMLIAFPGGYRTRNMIQMAVELGIEVIKIVE